MPNQKISTLSNNTSPTLADVLPIVNNGVTKKISLSGLTVFISGNTGTQAATQNEVDNGIATNVYVNPYTFANAAKWNTKVDYSGLTFSGNIVVNLANNKTFGKYTNGQTIPSSGLTAIQVITMAAIEYINPTFTSFSVNVPNIVESGTIINGTKLFTWSILNNSGTVPTISIYDNTESQTLETNVTNNGSYSTTVGSIQLNNGGSQSWKLIGNDTNPSGSGLFNSSNYIVNAYYYIFYGNGTGIPNTSSDVRSLPSRSSGGLTSFNFSTGTSNRTFVVALPTTKTLISIIDTTASNADITSQFNLSSFDVNDAGGNPIGYNIYVYQSAIPYTNSHNFQVNIS